MERQKFTLIQAVRGFAALWVVLFHASEDLALAGAVLLIHPAQFEGVSMATGLGLLLAGRLGWLNAMDWRPAQFLGAISYSPYLTPNPVTGATFFILSKAHVPETVALVLTVCVCIAVAASFSWVFERPAIQLAHRIKLWDPAKQPKEAEPGLSG